MVLYPLRRTRQGRQRGEFPLGTLCWGEAGLELDCPDRKLRTQLREFFARPVQVRMPRGALETVLGFAWKPLIPGTEEHYRECLGRLQQIDLVALPED
ncbi:MAG: hypothetical protein HY319_18635 [Armatimonadetes bacterium]|nr:hypothetical protein [Armatimonadota bacterium]